MVAPALQRTVAHLRLGVQAPGDDELLRCFSQHRDEAAFAELVRRHGAMVMGVARRALDDHHAAEDVLQATFLLLSRKARHVGWRPTVGPWLYAAAFRLAREAGKRRGRRAVSFGSIPLDSMSGQSLPPDQPLLWQEVRTVLDEELAQLPESLRAPLVLCYLQGLTRDEAAPQLGLTVATLKRRLEKGRERLRCRLSRRGLSLTAALGALLVGESALSATAVRTVAAAACAGTVSAPVAALLRAGIGRWQKVLALVLLVSVGMGGTWFAALKPALGGQPAEPPEVPVKPALVERTDALGDPLPDGAVSRLGTVRFSTGNMAQAIAFSPDGSRLATWAKDWLTTTHHMLTISDVATGRELRMVPLPQCELMALRWLADGRGLAVMKVNTSEYFVWEFTDETAPLPQVTNPVMNGASPGDLHSVAISPDGRWLATGRFSHDGSAQPIELWEVTANTSLAKLKRRELGRQTGDGQFVVFSADGKKLFALSRKQKPSRPGAGGAPGVPVPFEEGKIAGRAQLVVYETATGKRLSEFDVAAPWQYSAGIMPAPDRLILSRDGKSIYVGDEKGSIHIYDWATGKETASLMAQLKGDLKRNAIVGVNALALSPDGRTLYSAGNFQMTTFWNLETQKPLIQLPDSLPVNQFAVSPNGTKIATVDLFLAGIVHVLDAKTGADLVPLPGHTTSITAFTLMSDGTAATLGADHTLRQWDLESGRELRQQRFDTISKGSWLSKLTLDGRGMFIYDDNQQIVYVDRASGKKTPVTTENGDRSISLWGAFGSTFFLTTNDRKVRQWDPQSAKSTPTYDPPPPNNDLPTWVRHVSLSPNRRHVAIISTCAVRSGQMCGIL